jgi:autoinducer 2-degrading protein
MNRRHILSLLAVTALGFALLPGLDAAAQSPGVVIVAIDLVIIPSEMPKFIEAIKENGAASVKEPGCREFNITVLTSNPNHVFLYEVYDDDAAALAHRETAHFKKWLATTSSMIADRERRPMSLIAFNSKAH